jgi:predicted helicase
MELSPEEMELSPEEIEFPRPRIELPGGGNSIPTRGNGLLQSEFGQTLGSKGVHIIDPFTGTGTFVTRLLQSGLISKEQLPHKYRHEIHANEIVLLAYYIAAINIEAVYHSIMKGHAEADASPSSQSEINNHQSTIVNPSPTALGRPDGAQSSDGTEPRALPWATIEQAVGLEDASSAQNAILSSAPTGQNTPAQGNALGPDGKMIPSPEGAPPSSAPTGQNTSAQGNALSPDGKMIPSPEGATPSYEPFQGICLTDTFQLYEKGDLISNLLTNNSDRRKRQKALDIRVIMGNPPYSVGQADANDDNQNVTYPGLDERIRETYAKYSTSTLQRALYDSYIRAIRWASDRLGKSGIIGFVTNAGFVDAKTADGLRKCLSEEFSNIYVFHLRGNQRTSGELSRREGGKIFGSGSRAPIAITLLVKNPESKHSGQIYWHDIGDYLTQQQKLSIVAEFGSVNGISQAGGWTKIEPDSHHDWINQRDQSFDHFVVLSSKKSEQNQIFSDYSNGVKTNRDAWCYNSSKDSLSKAFLI